MQTMLSAVTTTVTGTPFSNPAGGAYQATVVGTGAVGATVVFEVSIDGVGWLTLSSVTTVRHHHGNRWLRCRRRLAEYPRPRVGSLRHRRRRHCPDGLKP